MPDKSILSGLAAEVILSGLAANTMLNVFASNVTSSGLAAKTILTTKELLSGKAAGWHGNRTETTYVRMYFSHTPNASTGTCAFVCLRAHAKVDRGILTRNKNQCFRDYECSKRGNSFKR